MLFKLSSKNIQDGIIANSLLLVKFYLSFSVYLLLSTIIGE